MSSVLSSVLLAASLAAPAFCQTAPATKTPSVAVFMDFDSQPGAVPLAVMEGEASKLLNQSGVSLDWRLAAKNRGDEIFNGLVVLKFKGQCRVDRWSNPGSDFGSVGDVQALGETRLEHGRVLPYMEVKCDQIRKALAYLRPEAGSEERQNAFGLALGRVVAHELYHILARTTAHAAHGLARASQSLEDLVSSGSMAFGEEAAQAIRNSLLP